MIIGIDGLGGSGKTIYARELQQQIGGSMLFHLDDFIHTKKIRYNDEFEEWYGYYHLQWRYDYLIETLLRPMKSGLCVNQTVEFYDKENDCHLRRCIEIPIGTTVIIEGVFLQRSELRQYFDFVIYLDVDKETRLKRVVERDLYIGSEEEITHKYENRYFPAEETYSEKCNPLALADFIQK
ncbi:uridine kinase [Sporosarcina limicola]|uniref:Uridine kinase n=1 Tax=Sporosarcina limicola TaxID=34101 RepID=A0A927R4Z4_9BACL|nr:uridine kinase [Sporosarcina limicola]MBE1555438.1 uridine kinase [Sporosarcina limicola]